MNVQEIRERLEKYNKGRVTGSVRVVGSFADWMAEELERQLDRNHELDKQLTEIKKMQALCHGELGVVSLKIGQLRRLAKALNKIEEVKG